MSLEVSQIISVYFLEFYLVYMVFFLVVVLPVTLLFRS